MFYEFKSSHFLHYEKAFNQEKVAYEMTKVIVFVFFKGFFLHIVVAMMWLLMLVPLVSQCMGVVIHGMHDDFVDVGFGVTFF